MSPERKGAYYAGMGLIGLGFLLFFLVFMGEAAHFGDFSNMESNAKSSMARAFGGMVLIVVGGVLRRVGARGLAGSGILLDPKQARRDLEPYSRMAGGMVQDALEETSLDPRGRPERVVMVKCASCGRLNEEDSKFCQECGKGI